MNASWTAMLRGKRCGGTISKEKRERIREKVYDLTVVNRKTRTERRRSFSAASQRLRQVRLLASHQCGITSPSRISQDPRPCPNTTVYHFTKHSSYH